MHFNQILPCLLVSATVAVAQLIPVGPIVSFLLPLPTTTWVSVPVVDAC